MTPAVLNPRAVVLVDVDGKVAQVATNIDPELAVEVVRTRGEFNDKAEGMTFNSLNPLPPQQTLSSAASKASYAKV